MRLRSGNEYWRNSRKVLKSSSTAPVSDFFERLPDNIVLAILVMVASCAASPSDLFSILLTCKRIRALGVEAYVLSKASPRTFPVQARNWSESARQFLQRCSDAGNFEACYTLGMIEFYCMRDWVTGTYLLEQAARNGHASAQYSLAIIQFIRGGGSEESTDLTSAVTLCSKAACQGDIHAMLELGHLYTGGYGGPENTPERRDLVARAALGPVGDVLLTVKEAFPYLINTFEWNIPPQEGDHPANRFLTSWFSNRNRRDVVVCANWGCGRAETTLGEFPVCNRCGVATYCSFACFAIDWKRRHMVECGRRRN